MGSGESALKPATGAGIPAPTSNPNIFVEFDDDNNFSQYWVRPGTIEYEILLEIHFGVRDEEEAARRVGYFIKERHDFCKETRFVENMQFVEENSQSDDEQHFDDRNSDSSDEGGNIITNFFGSTANILPFSNPLPVKDSDADELFNFQSTGALEEEIQMHPVAVAPQTTVRNRLNPLPPAPVVEIESRDPAAPGIHYYGHLPPQWSGWMATRFKAFPAMCRWVMVKEYMFDATNNRNGFHFDVEKKTQRQKVISEYFTYVDTFMMTINTLFKDINPAAIADHNLRERVVQAMTLQNEVKMVHERLHINQPLSKN